MLISFPMSKPCNSSLMSHIPLSPLSPQLPLPYNDPAL